MKGRNPFQSRDDEIERLKKELAEISKTKTIEDFAEKLATSILLVLGQMPYRDWPNEAKIAFDHEAAKTPTAAFLFKERLNARHS